MTIASGCLAYLCLCLHSPLLAATSAHQAEDHFRKGMVLYDNHQFEQARPEFEKAVELAPLDSVYHHMLGKCYGRIAENGSWLTALKYVGKTLDQFKKAVELDENNTQAWLDLQAFYLRAPAFFGGSREKAAKIQVRLERQGIASDPQESP